MKKILFIIFILMPIVLVSQTTISVKDLDYSQFPKVQAQIQAINNSQVVPITNSNIIFIEGAFTHRDFKIWPLVDGWQTIEWVPDHNVISDTQYNGTVAFTYEKNTAYLPISIQGIEREIGTFIFKNSKGEKIHDLQFVNTAVGDTTLRSLSCDYFYNLTNEDGFILPIKVDSITISNDNFLYEWRGNQFNKQQPPTNVIFASNQIIIRFAPKESGPQSAILKVHYNKGAVVYLRIQGNKKKIEAKTNLEVEFPNGGETFTPCQDTIVAWKGNVKDFSTKVELSYNNGESWQSVDSIKADTLDWKVPNNKTSEAAKVRISQAFTKDAPFIFGASSSVYSVDYNFNSTKALSFSANAIYEWDLVALDNSNTRYDLQTRSLGFLPVSVKYISADKFVAIYKHGNFDSLAVFQVGNTTPIFKEAITDFDVKEIYTLKDNNEFIVLPQNSNYFRVYDSQTHAVKKDVIYNQPITDIGIANDTNRMVVGGLDGNVYIVSTSDFQIIDNIQFYRTPVISKLSMSPNGALIGMSSVTGANSGRTNSMIWDLESRNIITSLNISGTAATAVGFSPTGNMAIFAYQLQNQINIFNLVQGTLSGVIETFQDPMVDLAYSSENNSFLVSATGNIGPKFKQYFFTFPESDESDGTFRIINPIVEKKTIDLADGYIFNESKKSYSVEFCNKGEVPLFIEDAFFKHQVHFDVDNFALPDTILPDECIDITISFNPKDTSIVSDSLIIASCSLEYPVYVTGNGLNRNIEFTSSVFDLGEVCIQDTAKMTAEIFRNTDPVPLLFNRFNVDSIDDFSITGYTRDTLLQSGESITATINANPTRIGEIFSDMHVLHSNQEKYKATAKLRVQGIGTFVEVSHTTLPFIPEQRIRKLSIKNAGVDPVEITNLTLLPSTDFKLNTPTPFFIQPDETIEIEIEWIGTNTNVLATLDMEATPCLTQRFIDVVDYQADSEIDINDTDADPLDTTSISINFTNLENAPYNGMRLFEAILTIDPKMFIPEYAESEYGEATIENMGIESGKRLMKLSVNGDFPAEGTLAKIVGYPGLSDKEEALMIFDNEKSVFWGESTNNSTNSGLFTLLLTCNDQSIIHTSTEIKNISPNPVTESANVQIYSTEDEEYDLLVLNQSGDELHKEKIKLKKGDNIVRFDSSDFLSGSYIIVLKKDKIISAKNLIIVK